MVTSDSLVNNYLQVPTLKLETAKNIQDSLQESNKILPVYCFALRNHLGSSQGSLWLQKR